MDFNLTEDQKMLKTMVRDFAVKELEPVAAEIDEEARYPGENIKKMADLGLFGIPFPEQYGGSGGGALGFAIAEEELSRVCASTATVYFVSAGLAGQPIYHFGNEEQRDRFVPAISRGEKIAAFALTEPNAGSDPAHMETAAIRQGNNYVINGRKIFITNGAEADTVLVFATTDKTLGYKGVTAFVVEKGTDGYSVGKLEHKLGIRGTSTAELLFDNCVIPVTNRIGAEGKGFRIALEAIDASRISIAAQATGISQGALDKALAYAKDRQQFGQPIANLQAIQWMLADMATQIDAGRLLTYRAAAMEDAGVPFIKEACMAKVFAAEVSGFVTSKAIQIYGGYGYVKDYPIERYFRDARITEIYEGTSEMQRMTIARSLLKES